ncbi:DUF1573 domain-containing protein [Flammeovirga kamogawensis]|uniref:DUF1573 domain-containing protein n=1 Tax=Flammeovirga kamogawensis TaxID=373891 RepID=A0ABX8GZE7_9BACT|nr:DUF1573 domain-containing protein [Flammeovirga kamogawensis]MBB6459166.1 hypothetical protein [Flammeovirga kamogawensis]QWG08732.1 DUF1573 domain-containing protein [Flammeovirga kamogawensis]TRX67025.1 DUF1573 domain-containing protein [Flammeovirga kamogawensis]
MKNNIIYPFLIFLCYSMLSLNTYAQSKIVFEKTVHDFGDINEIDGDADVIFDFTNQGNKSLILTSVKASCGCTTPNWSTDPVAVKEKGFIQVSYSTKNRPGPFTKTISVRTNGTPQVLLLTIKGNVKPRPKGPKDWYPMEVGNLRFKTTHVVFGNILTTEKDTLSTIIYNQGDLPIKLKFDEVKVPEYIKVWGSADKLSPKDTVTLFISYDAAMKNDYGYLFEYFQLPTNDMNTPRKRINISSHIKEDFSEVENSGTQPEVSFDKDVIDFGIMKALDKEKGSFTITNNGTAELIIRKVKASCGCTATKPQKTQLAPGESTKLDVTFSAGNYNREVTKTISIVTNDPKNAEKTLSIKANVKSNEEN